MVKHSGKVGITPSRTTDFTLRPEYIWFGLPYVLKTKAVRVFRCGRGNMSDTRSVAPRTRPGARDALLLARDAAVRAESPSEPPA